MKSALIADANQSHLVIVDVQTKLANVMPSDISSVVKNCTILLQAAHLLDIPFVYTEQYPKGLGSTVSELGPYLNNKKAVEKTAFSCCAVPAFNRQLSSDRGRLILAGMEAHICVTQTALDLQAQGKAVFVVEDAIISRNPENKTNALNRLRQAGIIVTNTESVVFEWLKVAEGDAFKKISQLVR
jgi:nicotinamidase-related amidase